MYIQHARHCASFSRDPIKDGTELAKVASDDSDGTEQRSSVLRKVTEVARLDNTGVVLEPFLPHGVVHSMPPCQLKMYRLPLHTIHLYNSVCPRDDVHTDIAAGLFRG